MFKTAKEISYELLEESKEAQKNPREIVGIADYGPDWPRWNALTSGPQEKTFTLLMARPKVGKSTLMSQWLPDLAIQAQDAGKVVKVVTLETTMKTYQRRAAARMAKISDPLRIRKGLLDVAESKRYRLALKTLSELPIHYLSNEYDMTEEEAMREGSSAIGIGAIEDFIRDPRAFLWVIDHIGLINRRNTGRSDQQLAEIADRLAYISNRYVGGIGISHLNRDSLDGGLPSFENIAGTDVLGRNAGALYFLWRPFFESRSRTPEDVQMMEAMGGDPGLLIFFSRDEGYGQTGIFWNKELVSFEESDIREEDMPRPGQSRRGGERRRSQPHEDSPERVEHVNSRGGAS